MQNEWFKYNGKRVYIGGQENMNATYRLKTNPHTIYYNDYNNTNGVYKDIKITNRFSFTCRIGLCTFKNSPATIAFTPYTTNWINFNVVLGLTHLEHDLDDDLETPGGHYGTNSNLAFIRGKMSKGRIPF